MSSSDRIDSARALVAAGSALEAGCVELTEAELQDLMSVAVRLYAERVERDGDFPVVKPSTVTATEALVTTTALLRAVNVQIFELGLWQSWAHDAVHA